MVVYMDSSGSGDEEQYRTVGTEQSYLAKLEKSKKKRKPPQGAWNDALLEPDLAAFDHLQGFEPTGLRQRVNYNDDGIQIQQQPAGTSSSSEAKKKERKRVVRPALPACDYSKPLDHWLKRETINEMYEFFGLPPPENLLNTPREGQKK